jgi:hypothetical protein
LDESKIYAVRNQPYYILEGDKHVWRVTSFRPLGDNRPATWDLAFCNGPGELKGPDVGAAKTVLPKGGVAVRRLQELRDERVRLGAQSWESQLPKLDPAAALSARLKRFNEFVRCANQVELLLCDAEIFRYEVVERAEANGFTNVVIRELPRARALPEFLRGSTLVRFLTEEIDSGKPDSNKVILTTENQEALIIGYVPKSEHWTVVDVNPADGTVRMDRQGEQPPSSGLLRAYGLFGQVDLVRRRRDAIERLGSHTYLLRSLSAPGQVYMDTREANLPVDLNPDLVDEHKRAVIRDVLRVRPIYALQGPPGTGKTTLVAWLLREILEDDPVAQVLVTAQAHAAVDVLREKVRLEAFKDVPEGDQPLAVRLGRASTDDSGDDPDAVQVVAARILDGAIQRLSGIQSPTRLQRDWMEVASDLRTALRAGSVRADANDFVELVRRGANLTYCTTSAGELEELAETTQSYDWSIVEEAGKAHGFDLALPLQAGHRWLLIGDQKQLPPYRFEEYEKAFKNLDVVVTALANLPDGGSGLVDWEWLRTWRDYSDEDKKSFQDYAGAWLRTFATVFEECRFAPPATEAGEPRLTLDEAVGAAAGMLSAQHRMHPDIAELISQAYYDGKLVSKTVDADGRPTARVVHHFDTPAAVQGRAVVWLDTPWAAVSNAYAESRSPRYSNIGEARVLRRFLEILARPRDDDSVLELAVLTPYLAQVRVLNRELASLVLPPGVVRKRDPRRPRQDERRKLVHSVDSFQGNQADVVAVSLVRNHINAEEYPLGFLRYPERINVLLSRPERLLVLVGSWEFFDSHTRLIDLDDRSHPYWHWKMVLTTLERLSDDGKAVRLAVGDLDDSL